MVRANTSQLRNPSGEISATGVALRMTKFALGLAKKIIGVRFEPSFAPILWFISKSAL